MQLQYLQYDGLIDFIFNIWTLITFKDPCKKCIVRACCSDWCEHKTLLTNFIFPYNIIYHSRLQILWHVILRFIFRSAIQFIFKNKLIIIVVAIMVWLVIIAP